MLYDENFDNIKPYDYLSLSNQLYFNINTYNDKLKSAIKCTIISRAYLSIFLQVRNYLKANYDNYNYYFTETNEHIYVKNFICENKVFNKYHREFIKNILYKLKKHRFICDYIYNKPELEKYSKTDIQTLLLECENVFNILKENEN